MHRFPALLLGLLVAAPAAGQTVTDPDAEVGIEAGRFILYPATETTIKRTVEDGGTPAWSAVMSPELLIQSNFERHAAAFLLDIDLARDGSLLAALADLGLRFELGDVWALDLGAGIRVAGDDALDPALPTGFDATPDVTTTTADATLTGPIGDVDLRLGIGVARTVHDDVLVGGIPTDQSERDNTEINATFRVASGTGGVLAPFAEVEGGRRLYDVAVGNDGFLQAGNYAALRAGIAYDSAPVLTGEVAIGYRWEMPDDPALATSGGFTVDANAVWSPREVVAVSLATETTFKPNAGAAIGASVGRSVSFETDWAIRETLTLIGTADWSREWYADGTEEQSAGAGTALVWTPNPWSAFGLGYRKSWLWSPDPTRNGTSSTFTLTTRLLR